MDNFYVSPTEFASISGVSRQTLIFYEKKGIFLPAYKNEKGYRFYLMSQLDIIATIQSLQKIGLSLEEIKDYIEHRNAQSTYELFSNKINTLKDDNSFKAWITKILVNTAINHIKKESKTVFLEDEECESIYESNGVSIEEKLDLYRAIDFLKPKYKTVIIFRYFDDMKIEDISYMLDIPINTVKSQLKRATQQLNNILKENYLNV